MILIIPQHTRVGSTASSSPPWHRYTLAGRAVQSSRHLYPQQYTKPIHVICIYTRRFFIEKPVTPYDLITIKGSVTWLYFVAPAPLINMYCTTIHTTNHDSQLLTQTLTSPQQKLPSPVPYLHSLADHRHRRSSNPPVSQTCRRPVATQIQALLITHRQRRYAQPPHPHPAAPWIRLASPARQAAPRRRRRERITSRMGPDAARQRRHRGGLPNRYSTSSFSIPK